MLMMTKLSPRTCRDLNAGYLLTFAVEMQQHLQQHGQVVQESRDQCGSMCGSPSNKLHVLKQKKPHLPELHF